MQKHLQAISTQFFEIHFGNQLLISRKVPEKDAFISILTEIRTNVGYIRLELRKALKEIKDLL